MLSYEAFKELPIIFTTMSRWDGDISSASLALAKVFSRNNPVFYIDYPYSWADVYRERNLPSVKQRMPALLHGKNWLRHVPEQPENLMAATARPTLPITSLPMGKLYKAGSYINNKKIAALIKKICREKKINDFIFINSFNPYYLQEVEKYINPTISVYHSRDAIEEVPGNGLANEIECVKHYELAMATSKQLCRNIGTRTGKTVEYFPNGGDAQLFKTAIEDKLPKPIELQGITTPIIGYTGAICQRFNYELLEALAKKHADKTIVLVGPRRDKQFSPIDLDKISNIVFTGSKKIEELPAYLQYFDCAIMPFKYNNLTAGIYPLKINEYLAAGKAVVTTNFSEDVAGFADHVYLAQTNNDFITLVDKAIADNSFEIKNKRWQVASSNAWEKRVETFWQLAWNKYQVKNK
jgi:glycosyltransferase involved in cell wall biosynthesis